MDDTQKLAIFNCLTKYDKPREPVKPENSLGIQEIMELMSWSEDRARRKVRQAVDAGDMEEIQVGQRKYYRTK